ncbi:MAG: hypothetical protein IJ169_04730 [Paludibacteraceae bacterium]|nr:hypothetical protein [Paludibacteraceae bacterium]
MKKSYFFLAAILLATTAFATDYDIRVGGVQITSENKNSLVQEIQKQGLTVSGNITFAEDANMLILEDFNLSKQDNAVPGIDLGFQSVTVMLKGFNSIQGAGTALKLADASPVITGSGSLYLYSSTAAPVEMEKSSLKIMNTTLDVVSSESAVKCKDGADMTRNSIQIVNSDVKIKYAHSGDKNGYAIEGVDKVDIMFSDIDIQPDSEADGKNMALYVNQLNVVAAKLTNAYAYQYVFDAEKKNYYYSNNAAKVVTWSRVMDDENVSVAINGEVATTDNYQFSSLKSGKATFIKVEGFQNTDTLVLDNADISTTAGTAGINAFNNFFVIKLIGQNTISTNGAAGIAAALGTTICGDGSLRIISNNADAICIDNLGLSLEDEAKIEAVGECGLRVKTETNSSVVLRINDYTDAMFSGDEVAIALNSNNENGGLKLGSKIRLAYPYNPDEVTGAPVLRYATPEPMEIPFSIAGREVNSFNYENLHDAIGASGANEGYYELKYDPDKKELVFDNISFSASLVTYGAGEPFLKVTGDLNIVIKGTNQINTSGLVKTDFLKLQGGTLAVSGKYENPKIDIFGSDDNSFAELQTGATLSFEQNLTLSATGFAKGVHGANANTGTTVKFNYTDVTIGAKEEVYSDIESMEFENARIISPEEAAFSAELRGVAVGGQLVANNQVIVESHLENAIDDISGAREGVRKELRDGAVYIIRGDKRYNLLGAEVL